MGLEMGVASHDGSGNSRPKYLQYLADISVMEILTIDDLLLHFVFAASKNMSNLSNYQHILAVRFVQKACVCKWLETIIPLLKN